VLVLARRRPPARATAHFERVRLDGAAKESNLPTAGLRPGLHGVNAIVNLLQRQTTRKMSWQSTIPVGGARYSVPNELVDERVSRREETDGR
jgi:hypothetical protein